MGRLSHESSRSSIDTTSNGEGLPLYSDVTVTSPGELSVPSEKATADEVREFLMQLLIKNRGLHQDHARRVASKWTLGTGRELISYPPRLYAEIFGLEDAWMVYKEAKVFICTEKKKGKPNGFLLTSGIMFLIFAASLPTFLLTDLDDHTALKIITAFSSLVSGTLACMFCLVAILEDTIEAKVENELILGLKKSKD
ncbi:hypothetical protein E4T50_13278 [Aureobasidium sp. EXF-12298]|nr:hypothetical protein E4T50_13278 [Aureobasidium sp. EXF-12298]KAI4753941.1 hypothetical protein E4T51_12939 [Aureobasidium sp. EXF-12344]KAI4771117.1 hypothetical protein E4T52_13899 [Aureobasidium sp. EXF-3400]